MNGTSNLWFGAVLACAAGVVAWVMRAYVPAAVRVLVVGAAVLALVSVLYAEHQMNEKRQEISEIFE